MRSSDTSSVARAVRSALSRDIFQPATSRLLWVLVHLLVVGLCVAASSWWVNSGGPLWVLLPLSVVVGMSYAGLAFVAHETLHGALTRHRLLRRFIGWLGFLPFWVAPRLWITWHNNVHHGNTNIAGRDPDAYPTLLEARSSAPARLAVQWAAPRSGKWRGIITLAVGFSLQSLQILVFARSRGYLPTKHYAIAWLQTLGSVALWLSFGLLVGAEVFLMTYVLPLLVANAIVMAHIITNHSLSPLSRKNDALETSLTVSVPRWFEFYSLGFGYHVEHHLFPAMSNRHAPLVQKELRRLAPERYQEMKLSKALGLLFTTPRFYKTPHLLFDPETGESFRTLGPDAPELAPDVSGAALLQPRGEERSEVKKAWTDVEVEVVARDPGRISSIPPPPHAA